MKFSSVYFNEIHEFNKMNSEAATKGPNIWNT